MWPENTQNFHECWMTRLCKINVSIKNSIQLLIPLVKLSSFPLFSIAQSTANYWKPPSLTPSPASIPQPARNEDAFVGDAILYEMVFNIQSELNSIKSHDEFFTNDTSSR